MVSSFLRIHKSTTQLPSYHEHRLCTGLPELGSGKSTAFRLLLCSVGSNPLAQISLVEVSSSL